jgi:GT2 family glycosyltransferase
MAAPLALLRFSDGASDLGHRVVIGANFAVRGAVAREVGGFAPHLGKLRGTLRSGEDHDFCQRVQAAGYRAVYCPWAIVHHWVPAARMRLRYILSWFFWSGITHATLEATLPDGRHVGGVPLYLARRFFTSALKAAAAASAGRLPAAVNQAADAAFAAGYAAKRWRLVDTTFGAAHPAGEPA